MFLKVKSPDQAVTAGRVRMGNKMVGEEAFSIPDTIFRGTGLLVRPKNLASWGFYTVSTRISPPLNSDFE